MDLLKFISLVSLIGRGLCQSNIYGDWENPHNIFGESKSTEIAHLKEELHLCRDDLHELRETRQCRGPRIVKQPSMADHYLKRFLNILLSSANFKNRKLAVGNEMRVNLNMFFNSETLEVLQAFASDDPNGHLWDELDRSFILMFEGSSTTTSPDDTPGTMGDGFVTNGGDYHLLVLVMTVSSIAFSVIWVFLAGSSISSSIFVGFVLLVSTCFGWNWLTELEKQKLQFMVELSKEHPTGVPSFCTTPEAEWWTAIFSTSAQEKCLKYLEARNLHPSYAIDFGTVFGGTIHSLFLSWLPNFGQTLRQTIDAFWGNSWLGSAGSIISRILTGPVILIFFLLFVLIVIFFNKSIHFKTPLFQFAYGDARTIQQREIQASDRQETKNQVGAFFSDKSSPQLTHTIANVRLLPQKKNAQKVGKIHRHSSLPKRSHFLMHPKTSISSDQNRLFERTLRELRASHLSDS